MNPNQKNSPPLTDDSVLARYKLLNMPDEWIAQKLGLTVAEVSRRWKVLETNAAQQRLTESGYGDLIVQMNVMCHQYQLLGESLKIMCGEIGNPVTSSELKALIVPNDVEQTTINLMTRLIILHPFVPKDPAQELEKHMQQLLRGS